MDSQMSSDLLDKVLEKNIISLKNGDSDDDLLESDVEENLQNHHPYTKPYSIIDEL